MATERRPRTPAPAAVQQPRPDLKRIPLPPLPHFRRAATAGVTASAPAERARDEVSGVEMGELLGPAHEGGITPILEPNVGQRTGATGATILNDLVDQIEKGLERDLARAPAGEFDHLYRKTLACARVGAVAGDDDGRKTS